MGLHTGIAVIESKWDRGSNVSVRSLFDLIADRATGNPHAYHYEMAGSGAALKEAIARIATYPECRYLCLAMHGCEDGLQLINGDVTSQTALRQTLVKIRAIPGARLRGIHMASCLFGTSAMAEHLFNSSTDIVWVAGYEKEVDWIISSAFDLLFFNYLVDAKLQHGENTTELKLIDAVASYLCMVAPGLVRELGFGVYVRKQKTGGAKNLMSAV